MGPGLLAPEIPLTNFYPCGCGTSTFHFCAPPTSLDECGFFNSVVVRLPFSLISERWLFYILVVILMWLCKEVSHVCLLCHLNQKSLGLVPEISFG